MSNNNPYIEFYSKLRKTKEFQGLSFAEAGKLAGQKWRALKHTRVTGGSYEVTREKHDLHKYVEEEHIPEEDFCGTAAGMPEKHSFPITKAKWAAARSYRRFAKNKAGLDRCMNEVAQRHGWY